MFDGPEYGAVSKITAGVVEATWRDVASFSDNRGRSETARAQREQPDLLVFMLATTEHLSSPVHALAFYVFLVIWQIFRRSTSTRIPRIKARAIERQFEQNEQSLSRLEGVHTRFLERAAAAQVSQQPAVFRYMVEAIMEAPDDPDDPVEMTEEESGTLFLVLKTVIDVLHDARQRVEGLRTTG